MLKRLFQSGLLVVFLLIGTNHTSAMQATDFLFQKGELNARWTGFDNLKAEQTDDGIRLESSGTGTFLADVEDFVPRPDAALLTTSSATPVDLQFLWKTDAHSAGLVGMTIPVDAGVRRQTPILLSTAPIWNEGHVSQIGITLPPNTTIVLHDLSFGHWNWLEKALQSVRSFWSFDTYKPYAINFLWGPMQSNNPIQRQFTYRFAPPTGLSWTYILSIVLILLTVMWVLHGFIRYNRYNRMRKILPPVLWTLLIGWILLDSSMGLQFLAWVKTDFSQYVFQPAATRTFRDRDQFYDFALFAKPLVADRESYVLLTDRDWPYTGNIRYLTYPALPGQMQNTDDTWVIFNRPEISVLADGSLASNNQHVTRPGKILGSFGTGSFVFRVFH